MNSMKTMVISTYIYIYISYTYIYQLVGLGKITGTSHDLHGKIWLVSASEFSMKVVNPVDASPASKVKLAEARGVQEVPWELKGISVAWDFYGEVPKVFGVEIIVPVFFSMSWVCLKGI